MRTRRRYVFIRNQLGMYEYIFLICNHTLFYLINLFIIAAPPYWVEGGIKQYYVSKRCATRATCDAVKTKTLPYCTYLWYQDWKCAECCLGDRCNYYITVRIYRCIYINIYNIYNNLLKYLYFLVFQMGSSAVKSNLIVLLGCIAILIGFNITKNV